MKKFLTIGEITKPHGVRGEVKVFPLTDDPKRFLDLEKVLIDGKTVRITRVSAGTDRVILKLQGVDTLEQAEALRKKTLEVPREDAVELEEDAYFIEDLKDCIVYDTNGVLLGQISDVIATGSNDVYWIKKPKELLIPALKDIVVSVDIKGEKVVIRPVSEWSYED